MKAGFSRDSKAKERLWERLQTRFKGKRKIVGAALAAIQRQKKDCGSGFSRDSKAKERLWERL